MELNLLNESELETLYHAELVHDFPPAELKPLWAMTRMMEEGCYQPLVFVDNEEILGYALMLLEEERRCALLDYLAVLRGRRNAGLGSRLLALLGERFKGIIVESEAPDAPTEEENTLRRRRLAFYERCGFRMLDYECGLFGVHYRCLYRGPEKNDRTVLAVHQRVYSSHVPPAYLDRYVRLPLEQGEIVQPISEWREELPS